MGKFCCFTSPSEVVGGQASSRSGKGRSDEGLIKYGFSLVKGKANHPMEDYHVANFINSQGHELGLFAIYDGHMGDTVPAYLQKHLFSNILKEGEFWVDPRRSIAKAYEKTDQAILSNSSDLGRGGSTAVTAILINGRKLWVANVGDSRAVLSRGGSVMQMSTDHEPRAERSSIEDRGGFVSNLPGDVPRVNGQLAVSRAFGDKGLKTHLSSEPDIRDVTVDSQTDVLVLASDGIWKVMTNEEAMEIAKRVKDPQKAAKELTAEALRRESKDDISCVVVTVTFPAGQDKRWVPPTSPYMKCNTDCSWSQENGQGGVGWVLRDNTGHMLWAGARKVSVMGSALESEAEALRWAVQIMSGFGYSKVRFETDSQLLVRMLYGEEEVWPKLKPIVQEIRHSLLSCEGWAVGFYPRSGNKVADRIAKETTTFTSFVPKLYSIAPSWLYSSLEADKHFVEQ